MAEPVEQAPETPYVHPGRTTAARMRSPWLEAHRWRLVATLALVGFLGTTASTIVFAYRRTVDLVVITVDEDNHVRAIGRSEVPEDRQILTIKGQLTQVVEWIRTIPADGDLLKLNWKRALMFMAPEGAKMLQQYGRETRPDELQKHWRVRVQVNDVQSVTKENYFVDWEERFYRVPDMSLKHTKRYRTVISFYLDPPMQDSEEARLNWLGVKIRDVTWYRQPDVKPQRQLATTRQKPVEGGAE